MYLAIITHSTVSTESSHQLLLNLQVTTISTLSTGIIIKTRLFEELRKIEIIDGDSCFVLLPEPLLFSRDVKHACDPMIDETEQHHRWWAWRHWTWTTMVLHVVQIIRLWQAIMLCRKLRSQEIHGSRSKLSTTFDVTSYAEEGQSLYLENKFTDQWWRKWNEVSEGASLKENIHLNLFSAFLIDVCLVLFNSTSSETNDSNWVCEVRDSDGD